MLAISYDTAIVLDGCFLRSLYRPHWLDFVGMNNPGGV